MTTLSRDRLPQFVAFRENQILDAADLNAQQLALRAARWQHNRLQHGFGIVLGLELLADDAGLSLGRGLAFDPLGREVILGRDQCIEFETLEAALADIGDHAAALDLWLMHHEVALAPGIDHGGRVVESACVHFTLAGSVLPGDPMADGVEAVFLGRWWRHCGLDLRERVYVSAVGSMVEAPSGSAAMQVGQLSPNDGTQFAVSIRDRDGKLVERFAVETDARSRVNGSVRIHPFEVVRKVEGRTTVEPLSARLKAQIVAFRGSAAPPPQARPWSVYRASVADPQSGATREQLRIELQDPGKQGSPPLNQLVIGVAKEDAPLVPILTVNAAGDLIVDGLMVLHGGVFIVEAGKPDTPGGTPGGGSSTPQPGRLSVDVGLTEPPTGIVPGDPQAWKVRCKITLNNIGPRSVANLLLAVRVSARRGNATESNPPQTISIDTPLEPGQSLEREQAFPIPGTTPFDKLIVGVTALGVESSGEPVGADMTRETP